MSATKTPEVKAIVISDATRELAAKLNITIDPKTGAATQAATVESLLPEDVSVEQYKRVFTFVEELAQAQTLAHGEAAIPVMKKNPELASSELVVKDPSGNQFGTVFYRSKLVGAPGAEKSDKFGVIMPEITLRASRKTGQLGNIRAHLSALATKQLASK